MDVDEGIQKLSQAILDLTEIVTDLAKRVQLLETRRASR
jgi:hypothetical protein